MNEGEIVQSGTPVDIYDEPINHFVATFIGESNILDGRMIEDYLVEFNGKRFEAVDGGMRPNEPVEVVIRPEDLQITLPEEGKLQVKVDTQLFRGVHYEISTLCVSTKPKKNSMRGSKSTLKWKSKKLV